MARNQSSQTPSRGSCDRIRKATFGRFRRSDPSFSSKSRLSFTQPMALQQPFSGKEIPIEYVPPPEVKSVKNVRFSGKDVEKDSSSTGGKELADQKTFGEAKFDSFIGRMKMKMSAPSDVGGAKTVSGNDSFNDKVSTFIGRARLKLRATSSMGANGKTVSFK
ncbi:hypothetical protein L2E82_00122 [Cichorium intybus]|uniref:Uncharacterized protein n=1 Tax=Cichorium intybus TaxID=13427 RepID=A0ACB9GWJ3_CICIN|nr:hypothetical protein L2E82_00122 [Cichorium intybus]